MNRAIVTQLLLFLFLTPVAATAQRNQNLDAFKHIEVLADDSFEGRRAGSKGGHAAAGYIVKHLSEFGLITAGEESYFQPFNKKYENCRNYCRGIRYKTFNIYKGCPKSHAPNLQ